MNQLFAGSPRSSRVTPPVFEFQINSSTLQSPERRREEDRKVKKCNVTCRAVVSQCCSCVDQDTGPKHQVRLQYSSVQRIISVFYTLCKIKPNERAAHYCNTISRRVSQGPLFGLKHIPQVWPPGESRKTRSPDPIFTHG